MFEEFYGELPDVDKYLARIGISKPEKLDVETLNKIIFAHQCSIPFENLDPFMFKKAVSMETEVLYKKLIEDKRGGFCFELNGLFETFLRALGFDSYSCFVRVGEGDVHPRAISHRGVITTIDGEMYYCDVGFGGPMPSGAVKFQDGLKHEIKGEVFWLSKREEENWWSLNKQNDEGGADVVLVINTLPQEAIDFRSLGFFYSMSPDTIFTRSLRINVKQPEGHYAITDDTFTKKLNGVKTEETVQSNEHLKELLATYFNIVI